MIWIDSSKLLPEMDVDDEKVKRIKCFVLLKKKNGNKGLNVQIRERYYNNEKEKWVWSQSGDDLVAYWARTPTKEELEHLEEGQHKILRTLNLEYGIPFPFNEVDYPEIDNRDTYNMDSTFVCWIFEHYTLFKEIAGKYVDLNWHKFDFNGLKLTQEECIDRVIDDAKYIIEHDDCGWEEKEVEEEINRRFSDMLDVIKVVNRSMWW